MRGGGRLAVFAPLAVGGLGVDEAWDGVRRREGWVCGVGGGLGRRKLRTVWIDDWKDVEVVVVDEVLGGVVAGVVAVDQLVGNVLDNLRVGVQLTSCCRGQVKESYRCCNPLSSVYGSVKKNCWLAWSTCAPEMDTIQISSFVRGTCRDPFRVVGESGLQVSKVLDVILVRMVRVIPS